MKVLAIGLQVENGHPIFAYSQVLDVSSVKDEGEIINCFQEKSGEEFDRILVIKNDQVAHDFQPL